jgi:hypothetical protein
MKTPAPANHKPNAPVKPAGIVPTPVLIGSGIALIALAALAIYAMRGGNAEALKNVTPPAPAPKKEIPEPKKETPPA